MLRKRRIKGSANESVDLPHALERQKSQMSEDSFWAAHSPEECAKEKEGLIFSKEMSIKKLQAEIAKLKVTEPSTKPQADDADDADHDGILPTAQLTRLQCFAFFT